MVRRQFPQNSRPLRRQSQQHFPPVPILAFSTHIPSRSQPVQEFHRAVMLNLQPFRHFAHIRTYARRHSLNRQKHLMLSWFQPQRARRGLARMQVSADLMANLSQPLVFT